MAAPRSATARLALAAPAARPGRIDREALERTAGDLRALGGHVEDDGLCDTPRLVADAYGELLTRNLQIQERLTTRSLHDH